MFSLRYRYAAILVLAVYSYINTLFSEVYVSYGIDAPAYLVVAGFILITGGVWEANRLVEKLLRRYIKTPGSLQYLLVFFLSGIVCSALIAAAVIAGFSSFFLHLALPVRLIAFKLAVTYATRVNLFLHIINTVVAFNQKYKQKEVEAEELKRAHTQAQLQAIKNQVNPHFLFNNLNVLSSLVMLDNPDANKFVEAFARVYRYILSSQQQELIHLEAEIEFMEPYVFLLKKRFPDSIFVHVNVPQQYLHFSLPPVALQMLIENAIKHNIASRGKPLHINVQVDALQRLVVSNNLQRKLPDNESTQVGIKNISQRYHLIAGKEIEVIETNDTFSVLLPLIENRYENRNN